MQNAISILALPIVAAGAIVQNRFVAPDGTQAGAGANAYGIAKTNASVGERVAVTTLGTEVMETGAAIAAGALIEIDAQGRGVTHASGVAVARMAPGEVASGASQLVEVVLIPN